MKRFAALLMALTFFVLTLAACQKKETFEGGEAVTNERGRTVAAVATEKGGDVARDSEGQPYILVTDEDGKNVTDENGDNETEVYDFTKALVYGNTVELKSYKLTYPDGWKDNGSDTGVQIIKESNGDQINVDLYTDSSISERENKCNQVLSNVASQYGDQAVEIRKSVKIGDQTCSYFGFYIPASATPKGVAVTMAFMLYDSDDGVYQFQILGNRDMTEDDEEVMSILASIQYK